jgi:Cu+-exporting ATPase
MTIDIGPATQAAAATTSLELAVVGMTCASCAMRIERKLNRLKGVSASVNFATETAAVAFDPRVVSAEDVVAAVVSAGYTARLPHPPATVPAG